MTTTAYRFRSIEANGPWTSPPFPSAERRHIVQGVIGGFIMGRPRWAVDLDGNFIYGLDAKGKETKAAAAYAPKPTPRRRGATSRRPRRSLNASGSVHGRSSSTALSRRLSKHGARIPTTSPRGTPSRRLQRSSMPRLPRRSLGVSRRRDEHVMTVAPRAGTTGHDGSLTPCGHERHDAQGRRKTAHAHPAEVTTPA